jgi:phage/conjugal plasmid C-4 type zinc finger TraR family protein
MSDMNDRASALEVEMRERALIAQTQRAGLAGKTMHDSAAECKSCGEEIPLNRRKAVPGCQRCVECQTRREREFYER